MIAKTMAMTCDDTADTSENDEGDAAHDDDDCMQCNAMQFNVM